MFVCWKKKHNKHIANGEFFANFVAIPAKM